MSAESRTLDDHLAEQLQDPEFQAAWEAQELAYQLARLRIMRVLTQQELADRVGTNELYRRKQLLDEANATYAALREDPTAWQAAMDERDDWDVTLDDGLPED